MKTYRQFIEEAIEAGKEMVHVPREMNVDDGIFNHEDVKSAIHGVYEELSKLTGEDQYVHDYLSNHEDAHGLIKNIMGKMAKTDSSDREAIEQYRLTHPARIARIHHILSQPDYLHTM